ncbi:MAG: hypothetical protein ACK6D3_21845 [Planctomycetaceae bacterium]|jgi:hypothetical protein
MLSQDSEISAGGKPDLRDYELWIDRVGVYRVTLSTELLIGGPRRGDQPGTLSMLARLSRQHARIVRSGEGYLLRSERGVVLGQAGVAGEHYLADRAEFDLGEGVCFRLRIPHRLSPSARLEFVSDHRPVRRADGVVLMSGTCLLGPGSDCHVVCPDWSQTVVLVERAGQLWLKGGAGLWMNGTRQEETVPLENNAVVEGDEFRFRVEVIS